MQSEGWVVAWDNHSAAVPLVRYAVNGFEIHISQEPSSSEATERHNHFGLDALQLLPKLALVTLDLPFQRVAVVRRAFLHQVGDISLAAIDAYRFEEPGQLSSCSADKRSACTLLIFSGRFPNEE